MQLPLEEQQGPEELRLELGLAPPVPRDIRQHLLRQAAEGPQLLALAPILPRPLLAELTPLRPPPAELAPPHREPLELGLVQQLIPHLPEPKLPAPPVAVKSKPVPTEPAPTFTTPSAAWMFTTGSTEAGASGWSALTIPES
jgi:hypothetical protein